MRADGVDDLLMKLSIRHDHPLVDRQCPSVIEFRRNTVNVGDTAAGFFNQNHTTRVVPDFFLIASAGRQSQVNIGISAGHRQILTLTVDSEGISLDP